MYHQSPLTRRIEMSKNRNLLHFSQEELTEIVGKFSFPPFRATQIFQWIWKNRVSSLEEMRTLPKGLLSLLKDEGYFLLWPTIKKSEKSSDGTIKILYELEDLRTVETVAIPREDQGRLTVCISTQVGCRMGCTFCMTAQQKTERNLYFSEIVAQILLLEDFKKVTNVVVMGMGEPFDNYDELMKSLDVMMNDKLSLGIGAGKITVSTSGLLPKIEKFAEESKCRLAISLNAPNNILREKIMPINKAYPIEKLLSLVKKISGPHFPRARKRKFYVTFEYILMKEYNDSPEQARELLKLVEGIPCKINLLRYNENPYSPFKRPEMKRVLAFQEVLINGGQLNFLRKSRGRDISAACGQLASQDKRNSGPEVELLN